MIAAVKFQVNERVTPSLVASASRHPAMRYIPLQTHIPDLCLLPGNGTNYKPRVA